MSQLTREAWKAYFRGNFLRAGDLYKSAGLPEKALKMYLKGGDYRAAAEVEELLGHVGPAVDLLLRMGDPVSASELLGRHGQFARAAQIMGESGNRVQAAAMALKGGNTLLAGQYMEQAGRYIEAGRLMAQADQVAKALLLFEKALKQMPSMQALTASEQLQKREQMAEIARFFEENQTYDRAAEVHESLGNAIQAAQCWEANKQYDRAIALYERVGAIDRARSLADRAENIPISIQAEALAARGDIPEAAALFARAGNRERAAVLLESAGNLAGAAEMRQEMGDFELAGNLYYRIQAYLSAAECFQKAQLCGMAKQCYVKAGELSSAFRMACEGGEWEEAVDLATTREEKETLLQRLQTLPETPGDSMNLAILRARLFLDLEQPALAIACLKETSGLQGREEHWRLYVLGRANEDLGKAREAAEAYQRVLAMDVGFQDARERLESVGRASQPASQQERYRKHELIWEDEYGRWYRGTDLATQGPVLIDVDEGAPAIPGLGQDRDALQSLVGLQQGAVLALRGVGRVEGMPALIYEFFGGRPLTEWLREGYKAALYSALDKGRQLLEALAEAHARKLLHSHLSPSALLMDGEGKIKVRGFGLVRDFPGLRDMVQRGNLVPYMAPETAFSQAMTPAADLYSTGAILLHLLTGQAPSGLLNKEERPPEAEAEILKGTSVPQAVHDLLHKLLAPNPAERYRTPEEALRDLSALELPPGSVIAGRYEILDELGRGGMGQVFRVRDRDLDEVVALKTLRRRSDVPEAARTRFLREIKLTRKVTHPNVVRVFDMGTWRDLVFLTMEFIPGKTLSQWVREGEGRRANLRRKVEILRGIGAGLGEAHRLGIVHRDLKPQNVILTPAGIPKLLDFGIAHTELNQDANLTDEGRFVGSPKYVSPEQIQGQALDTRSDIYCFGLLAYFLLTGQDAFTGENATLILLKQLKELPQPPSQLARLPSSLEGLVMWCLKKDPNERPAGLAEVLKVLKEIA